MGKLTIKNRFGIAPTELLNSTELTFKAKGLFTFIQSKPDNWNFSAKRIAQQSKDGIDGVNSGLQELEKAGYLKREKYQEPGSGHWEIEYILYDEPVRENPVQENPSSEIPDTEKPVSENPSTYSNIDPSKIDNSKKEDSKKETSSPSIFINKEEKILELFEFAKDPEFLEWYNKFLNTRKETRHKMTKEAEVLFFGKLNKIDKRLEKWKLEIAIKMIKKALEMSWRTIFPLKSHEIDEYIKQDTKETMQRIEAREHQEKQAEMKKEEELKKRLNEYWANLTDEKKKEIEDEAFKMAKKQKPDMQEQYLKPLIHVAKKKIIADRLKNET